MYFGIIKSIFLINIILLGNKVKEMLRSNDKDFVFPKTEANLFMLMNNIKNCNNFFIESFFY